MIPLAEAREYVLLSCGRLERTTRPLAQALGHVLADTVRASGAVPPFANSAMDGYALRAADTADAPARLRVVGALMAGAERSAEVGPGEAIRIMTGAPLPAGADAVCMVERTRLEADGTVVVIEDALAPGTNVRPAGEDISPGDEVFSAGTLLGPAHLGVLASLGVETVATYRKPVVGVVSTGDELARDGGPLTPGKIYDSNRPSLLAQLRADGFPTLDLGIAPDDETALADLLTAGAARCDAIVASGGVSVGDRDVVRIILEKMSGGTMRWMQVAIRPAKPLAFGKIADGTPVFGLPGNPVSALVSYELFARPALRLMAGFEVLDRPRITVRAETDLPRRPDGKLHLVRVQLTVGSDGELGARSSGGQESHMLVPMARANALALLPDGDGVRAGARVEVMLVDAERLVDANRGAEGRGPAPW